MADLTELQRRLGDRIKENDMDLVLMEIQMSVKDGYTATMEIREWERRLERTPVPILVLSAHTLESEKKSLIDAMQSAAAKID